MLAFGAPTSQGSFDYQIILRLAMYSEPSDGWRDYGEKAVTDESMSAAVIDKEDRNDYVITINPLKYYNDANSKVSAEAVEDIVSQVKSRFPGSYDILQIAESYEWIRGHIAYEEDEDGDYWQTAQETIERGTGDCEDQAILMASIVGALGGNARLNIIEGHAFSTVLIAGNLTDLSDAKMAIRSYYGLSGSDLHICCLEDEFGYWMVVDTTGFPYAGGLPTKASPFQSDNIEDWTLDSSGYLYSIDITGEVTSEGLF